VREEGQGLILGGGVPRRWLDQGAPIELGAAPTAFGTLSLRIVPDHDERVHVEWQADWHDQAPAIEVRLPGFNRVNAAASDTVVTLGTGAVAR
jgi:hypothetical protein